MFRFFIILFLFLLLKKKNHVCDLHFIILINITLRLATFYLNKEFVVVIFIYKQIKYIDSFNIA